MKHLYATLGIGSLTFLLFSPLIGHVYAEPYGWSPQVDFSNQGPPTCTDQKPDKAPVLLQPNHPALKKANEKGAIRLQWFKVPGASGYNVYYGLSPRNYIYSAADIPDTDNFTVRLLGNRTYYFAVQAKKGCAASSLSNEWSGRPGSVAGSGNLLGAATGFAPVKKQTSSSTLNTEKNTVVLPSNGVGKNTGGVVQGVEKQKSQPSYQPPATDYQVPIVPAAPQPQPKPKTLLEKILGIFGIGK